VEAGTNGWLVFVQALIGLGTIAASVLGARWVYKNKQNEVGTTKEHNEQLIIQEGNNKLLTQLQNQIDQLTEDNKDNKEEIRHLKAREVIFYNHMYIMDRWANKAYDRLDGRIEPVPPWPRELL
jgi:hypothetical protein